MLLEVLTRTHKRPNLLLRNRRSLAANLHGADWTQTVFHDEIGVGVGESHEFFLTHEPAAAWLWILDDDDECVYPILDDLRRITQERPETQVLMVRMNHGPLGILPDEMVWGRVPIHGHQGCSSYIVRRDVWKAHRHAFGTLRYQSDYDFIADVFAAQPVVYWHDVIASRCPQGQMLGRTE